MQFHHVAITVQDVDRSIEFYGHFGFSVVERWRADDGSREMLCLSDGTANLELMWHAQPSGSDVLTEHAGGVTRLGFKHLAIHSSDLETDVARLRTDGLEPVEAAKDARSLPVRYVFYRDPDGNWIELLTERP